MFDPFADRRESEVDPYATDWEQLDVAFVGLPEKLSYTNLGWDIRYASDIYLEYENRIDCALEKFRERQSIDTEMTSFVFRLYLDRKIYQPLLREVNKESRVVYSGHVLVWLHDGLLRANEMALLEQLWRTQLNLAMSRIIAGWHHQDAAHKEDHLIASGESVYGDDIKELAKGGFEQAIRFFRSVGSHDRAKWFTSEQEALLSHQFLKPKNLPFPLKHAIDLNEFWDIVLQVNKRCAADQSMRIESLVSILMNYSGSAIKGFARNYVKVRNSLAHHDVTALLMFAYGTDYKYDNFCEELIWRGERDLVEGLVERPIVFAERLPSVFELDTVPLILDATVQASLGRGAEQLEWPEVSARWKGRRWNLESINERYPVLAAQFGNVLNTKTNV